MHQPIHGPACPSDQTPIPPAVNLTVTGLHCTAARPLKTSPVKKCPYEKQKTSPKRHFFLEGGRFLGVVLEAIFEAINHHPKKCPPPLKNARLNFFCQNHCFHIMPLNEIPVKKLKIIRNLQSSLVRSCVQIQVSTI